MSNDLEKQVRLLKAIADATRLRVLGLLAERPHSGRELADALSLTAPTVSHHMQRLVEVGVVTATPDATRRIYTLNQALLQALAGEGPVVGHQALADDPEHQRTLRIFFDGPRLPRRDANEAQEVPAGEAAWLGALIRGAVNA